jgi:biotin carboxylase
MINKTILILGAGFGQIPAIIKSKELGLTTICLDKNPNAVGSKLADYFYPIDIVDNKAVLELAIKHKINGIMTMQSDIPVPTVGFINDELKLNGISLKTANICSFKNLTRIELQKKNAAQPLFKVINSKEIAKEIAPEISFPLILKSSDSSGSRGVVKVNNLNEINDAFDEAWKYSRNKEILIEEYIDGIEFGAQTFSVNGKCEQVLLHNDTMSPKPYMIPIGHSFPFSMLDEKSSRIAIEDIKNAVEAIGIENGPANIDLILDKRTNRVKVIEIGARIGATCLPELVHYHTGIDWVKQTILNSVGEEVDLKVKENNSVAAIIIESPKDGIFKTFEIKDKNKFNNILEFEITAKEGDNINKLRKGTDRIGKIIASSYDVTNAEKIVSELRKDIIISFK